MRYTTLNPSPTSPIGFSNGAPASFIATGTGPAQGSHTPIAEVEDKNGKIVSDPAETETLREPPVWAIRLKLTVAPVEGDPYTLKIYQDKDGKGKKGNPTPLDVVVITFKADRNVTLSSPTTSGSYSNDPFAAQGSLSPRDTGLSSITMTMSGGSPIPADDVLYNRLHFLTNPE